MLLSNRQSHHLGVGGICLIRVEVWCDWIGSISHGITIEAGKCHVFWCRYLGNSYGDGRKKFQIPPQDPRPPTYKIVHMNLKSEEPRLTWNSLLNNLLIHFSAINVGSQEYTLYHSGPTRNSDNDFWKMGAHLIYIKALKIHVTHSGAHNIRLTCYHGHQNQGNVLFIMISSISPMDHFHLGAIFGP